MPVLRVNGSLDTTGVEPDMLRVLPKGSVTLKYSARLQISRAAQQPTLERVNDDDLVELELEDGLRLWTRVDDMQRDYGLKPSRGADGDVIEIPTILPMGGPTRGVGGWVVKGLRVLGIDIAEEVVDFVSDKVEGQLAPGPGLYRSTAAGPCSKQRIAGLNGHQPTLVFLHGTASSSEGSFGGLWEGGTGARIHGLLSHYDAQVLAFQHRTLTESPVENARALAKALAENLPRGAELHLVSHSRGGLIGELLARGMRTGGVAFDLDELQLFDSAERAADRKALEELGRILAKAQFKVTRFVRVACPARGTTLAGERLDRYFSIIANLLGAIPVLKASPVYDGIISLVAAVVKKRTDPRSLPGLEAMMPTSPLVAMLNRPDLQTSADLHIVGGDIEGASVWQRLKVLATDLFYLDDHDLVVPTRSMFGGTARTTEVRYWIDTGPAVNHFSYFRNVDTAGRVAAALTSPTTADFHSSTERPQDVSEQDYRKRALSAQPVVFVVPGIMGSHLDVGTERVWLDFLDLARGGMARLQIDAKDITPTALVGGSYRQLVRFLSDTHEVVPFPYDWRRSLEDAASELRIAVEARLDAAERQKQPIRIVAHSMGGLVVRTMIGTPAGAKTWQRMCQHPGARLVMLGTPNGGSHAIAAMLIGRDPLVRKLALLDIKHPLSGLVGFVSRFDGALQMLPRRAAQDQGNGSVLDLFDMGAWRRLRDADVVADRGDSALDTASSKSAGIVWSLPEEKRLRHARDVLERLTEATVDPTRMVYVAGNAAATPCGISIDESAPAGRRVTVMATANGDGRVPWATGIPQALKSHTYYMDAEHGDLADTPDSFPALLDLITAGTTSKLPQQPPAHRSAAGESFVMRDAAPETYPDEADLAAAAMGSSRRIRRATPRRRTRVRIVHENLGRATSPVLVGHYEQDDIVSAEAYLDRQLDGRLRERRRLGLYPGPLNTSVVAVNDITRAQGRHPGAVVMGLGAVGGLTPGGLTSTIDHAVRDYAAEILERWKLQRPRHADGGLGKGPITGGLTTIVVGANGGGVSTADALLALLRGVGRANARLRQPVDDEAAGDDAASARRPVTEVFIDRLDIFELYEDRAIVAAQALAALARSTELRRDFDLDDVLVSGSEGLERAPFGEDAAWWQRLRIVAGDDGQLLFEALTSIARVDTFLALGQRRLVDQFIDRATAGTATDPALCHTLFELLMPHELKHRAPDQRHLALVLDACTAQYPWELLHDRFDRDVKPVSVESGMIRQLSSPSLRDRPQYATENCALVIGDPSSSDDSGTFPPLPGAAAEAQSVAKVLRAQTGWQVFDYVEADADAHTVVTELYARPYRILHIAAHGVFEYVTQNDQPPRTPDRARGTDGPRLVTGVALGKGLFLTPAEFRQLRVLPELAFINCCHLGTTRGDTDARNVAYHRLAANVATELIGMGVKAVIAAGWSVDDAAAGTFATTFYTAMFDGAPFGEAVTQARNEIYERYPGSNTWGAYQCYGDPAFSFGRATAGPGGRSFVAETEWRMAVEAITNRVKAAGPAVDELRRELDALLTMARPAWLESARTAAAVGRAYGELKAFEKAVVFYDRITVAESADARINALEELANLKVRWAGQLQAVAGEVKEESDEQEKENRAAARRRARAIRLFNDAEKLLAHLIAIGPTVERLSLRGSLYKRRVELEMRSVASDREARTRQSLVQMADSYRKAFDLACAARRNNAWYPLLNAIAGEAVLGWMPAAGTRRDRAGTKRAQTGLRADLRLLEQYASKIAPTGTDFWEAILPSDTRLLDALATRTLSADVCRELEGGYRRAAERVGSPKQLSSVGDQLRFFEHATQFLPAPDGGRLFAALRGLRASLTGEQPAETGETPKTDERMNRARPRGKRKPGKRPTKD